MEQRAIYGRPTMDGGEYQCPNCHNVIDPDTCWCGDGHNGHPYHVGHNFVPMGCVCGYPKEARDEQG